MEAARRAKKPALAAFEKIAQVVGIGITQFNDGYALKVNLASPPADGTVLPKAIDGVPVQIEVVGKIRKQRL